MSISRGVSRAVLSAGPGGGSAALCVRRTMKRAIDGLGITPQRIIVDGNYAPKGFGCPIKPVVKGDQHCLSVAAASIIAKVFRDKLMVELDVKYPGYGFASHKGYSAPVHFAALKKLGPCEIHRQSFSPVAEAGPSPQLGLFPDPDADF